MGINFMKDAVKGLCTFAKVNAGPISTVVVILGMVTAFSLAAKAGKEAAEDIEEAKEELEVEELTLGEKVKFTWKRFLPAVFVLLLTITSFVYTTRQMAKRYAALSAAYSLTESYLKDYMDATKEAAGQKKEQTIHDAVNMKQAQKIQIDRGVTETGYGNDLFFDAVATTRYFHSSFDHVKKMEEELARIYDAEDSITVSDYTFRMGLGARLNNGDTLGWKKSGKFDGTSSFSLYYTAAMSDRGEPYIVISQGANRMTDLLR